MCHGDGGIDTLRRFVGAEEEGDDVVPCSDSSLRENSARHHITALTVWGEQLASLLLYNRQIGAMGTHLFKACPHRSDSATPHGRFRRILSQSL